MRLLLCFATVAVVLASAALTDDAQAVGPLYQKFSPRVRHTCRLDGYFSRNYAWHGQHYDSAFGAPVALVVPPTVTLETQWGWGVGNSRIVRVPQQFARRWPGHVGKGNAFQPTPAWPSDTTQFGVYPVRGPW